MTGIAIDPKLVEFSPNAQQAISQIGQPQTTGGVSVDQENVVPIAESAKQAPRVEAPSGFVQGLGDPLYGAAQLIAKGLESVPADYTFMGRPVAASAKRFVEQVVPQRESDYQIARAAAGLEGIDWPRIGGNVVTSLAPGGVIAKGSGAIASGLGSAIARATGGATKSLPLVQSAITGGASSALMTPVESSEDFWRNKLQQTIVGAGVGMGIDKTLGAIASPAMTEYARQLKELGVKMTPGEAFGGMTKKLEDFVAKLPITGHTVRSAQQNSLESFNSGVVNKSLEKIGEKLPQGMVGRDAISYYGNKANESFEQVKPKVELGNTLNLYTGLRDISNKASSLNSEQTKYINDFIKNDINAKLANGPISGEAFKKLDSSLRDKAVNYLAGDGVDREFANTLYGLRQLIRDELRPIDPNDVTSLKQLQASNSVWADKLRVERAAGYAGSKNGVFTPENLYQAAKAFDITSNKGASAKAAALLQPEAQAAINAGVSTPVKSTNIGGGIELTGGVGAGTTAAMSGALPLTAALPLVPLAAYTSLPQAGFRKLMMSGRPEFAQDLRKELPAMLTPSVTGGLLRDPDYAARFDFRGMQNK